MRDCVKGLRRSDRMMRVCRMRGYAGKPHTVDSFTQRSNKTKTQDSDYANTKKVILKHQRLHDKTGQIREINIAVK